MVSPPPAGAVLRVAQALSRAAADWCLAHGYAALCGEQASWSATCPARDLDEVLAALLALEHGRLGPARDLTARYSTSKESR